MMRRSTWWWQRQQRRWRQFPRSMEAAALTMDLGAVLRMPMPLSERVMQQRPLPLPRQTASSLVVLLLLLQWEPLMTGKVV